ncbi:MAG: hypothetical protein AAF349_04700 [Cyanobacteria bacterium P01_A01_bin.68]
MKKETLMINRINCNWRSDNQFCGKVGGVGFRPPNFTKTDLRFWILDLELEEF